MPFLLYLESYVHVVWVVVELNAVSVVITVVPVVASVLTTCVTVLTSVIAVVSVQQTGWTEIWVPPRQG